MRSLFSAADVYRATPSTPCGTGALVLAGSSGRIDCERADLLARHGADAMALRWFGGVSQRPSPHEVPLETFVEALSLLRPHCDRLAGPRLTTHRRIGICTNAASRQTVVTEAATIPVERIGGDVVLVTGEDDHVWPSADAARRIARRRAAHNQPTQVIVHPGAGHRTVLPGESAPTAGATMDRGGNPEADAALGRMAWPRVAATLKLETAHAR